MKPKMMEMVQTSQDALPTVAAIPPIENSTSAGTPLATQNAPVQSIFRCRLCAAPAAVSGTFAAVAVLMAPPKLSRNDDTHITAKRPESSGADAIRAFYALAQSGLAGPKWFGPI